MSKTILIVDDSTAGYEVDEAVDGRRGLGKAKPWAPPKKSWRWRKSPKH